MHGVLNENLFLIKITDWWTWGVAANYDIYDPERGRITMECREKRRGIVTKIFRSTAELKNMTPFDIQVRIPYRHQIVRVTRGISAFRSVTEMNVLDENDRLIGGIKHRDSGGGELIVFDTSGRPVCRLVVEERKHFWSIIGAWAGCDFKFMADETELAHVTKDWAGKDSDCPFLGKGPFYNLNNCMLEIAACVARDNVVRQLILAAVMCIDMVRPPGYATF